MTADIRAIVAEHECGLEWGGPDWSCGAEDCNAVGNNWDDYADHIAAVAETCKHCGESIESRGKGYGHTSGPQAGKTRCAVEPYGYDAAPAGVACSIMCRGSRDGVEGRVDG